MGDFNEILSGLADAATAAGIEFKSPWFLLQLAIVVVAALIAPMAAALVRRQIDLVTLTMGWPLLLRQAVRTLVANLGVFIFYLLVLLARVVLIALPVPKPVNLVGAVASLAGAWLIIHLLAGFIRNRFALRIVALAAWTLAALSILGILEPTAAAFDSMAITFGGFRVSALLVLKTLALLMLALWAAAAVSNFVERRLRGTTDLTPSAQVLIGKLARVMLITAAIVIVMSSVGIDLSAFALFSGAIGVGIGFGLQKIVSNLLCGIILVADKSIKPGDVITVGDGLGWVVAMGARHTTVSTRDGREILIPNEDLVTQRVVNWSYSKDRIRLDVSFGVDIASDPHQVRRVAVQAARSVPRVLESPAPVCHFAEFSSRSLDFLLRFWIDDPVEGATNVRGAVVLALWDAMKREGIPIPSPVQELHLQGTARMALEGPLGKNESAAARQPGKLRQV
jgi:small-conductance mechanosensitive channel